MRRTPIMIGIWVLLIMEWFAHSKVKEIGDNYWCEQGVMLMGIVILFSIFFSIKPIK